MSNGQAVERSMAEAVVSITRQQPEEGMPPFSTPAQVSCSNPFGLAAGIPNASTSEADTVVTGGSNTAAAPAPSS